MKPSHFNPFRRRLDRDIRNNLSRSFLQALAEKDMSAFEQCGADFLQRYPEPVYTGYVTDRLEKYEKAYALIKEGQLEEVLPQAAIFWDLGLFFEMHELLELEWKAAGGAKRRALQGLIRAAGMKIHAENSNDKAAFNMGRKALADLVKFSSELAGFSKIEEVLAEIRQTLGTAETTRAH
jgi:predicted metal-dependent hydrolase